MKRGSSTCTRWSIALMSLLVGRAADYSGISPKLEPIIRDEMRDWDIGGLAVALVDDQQIVYAAGFGEARRDSIFRCGSISKLFNALAVMQQVEAGKVDLDAPLSRYGQDLVPLNPFPGEPAVTLRQVLCHRSGFPREGAVGGYLDSSQPGLAATVASVAASVLATVPGEKTRYSNLAPSVAGYLVERISGQSFEAYQLAHVLGPFGMSSSSWTLAQTPPDRLLASHLRVADGRGGWIRRDTPLFDLGTIPAGNLFSTADDLARFVSALAAGVRGVVKPETLAAMWHPQLTTNTTGFGLGFMVGKYREHPTVSHSGAVYGHSTSLVFLPTEKLGVVILANEDIVNGRVHRISQAALSQLLQAKLGEAPSPEAPPVAIDDPAEFAGEYESPSYWARIEVRGNTLVGDVSGQFTRFTARGSLAFTADSRIEDASPVQFERDSAGRICGFTLSGQHFTRTLTPRPPLPAEWRAFQGRYGSDFIPLIVSERNGRLYAMTENMVDYHLTPVNRNVCALPPGMYADEQIIFLTDAAGRPTAVNFANMTLPRRP